ncbi:MAG: DUF2232 domain-containing protein [Treponema sp.]|nr:DUF2232 domain-containing protein [Treponema sp.]
MKAMLIPGLVCAVLSVVLMRTGFLAFFFLVPLGYAAVVFNSMFAWFACVIAIGLNAVFSLGMSLLFRGGISGSGLDIFYFSVLALGFTWIMAGGIIPNIRTMYRFIAAAAAGALTFFSVILLASRDPVLSGVIRSQVEMISSAYITSQGADAARQSFLERLLTPERILETITAITMRGGALVSAFFLLFISRQTAYIIARLFRRRPLSSTGELSRFHVPANTIWVLSVCLLVLLLSRLLKAELAEIAAWNVLTICAILFLAQGSGIVLHTLIQRPMPPLLRLLCNVLIIVLIFSPGINMFALGGLVLLGIAENWLPLRLPKNNGPASTPGL